MRREKNINLQRAFCIFNAGSIISVRIYVVGWVIITFVQCDETNHQPRLVAVFVEEDPKTITTERPE